MPIAWFWISVAAFACAIVLFLVSGFLLARVLSKVLPLLDDTRNQVQDLGDLAASTVGHASETLDIVEERVSQTMGQVATSGKAAASQALGVGTTLTGLYMVTRLVGAIRKGWHSQHRKKKRSHGWLNFKRR